MAATPQSRKSLNSLSRPNSWLKLGCRSTPVPLGQTRRHLADTVKGEIVVDGFVCDGRGHHFGGGQVFLLTKSSEPRNFTDSPGSSAPYRPRYDRVSVSRAPPRTPVRRVIALRALDRSRS